jgi:hypothetical protein
LAFSPSFDFADLLPFRTPELLHWPHFLGQGLIISRLRLIFSVHQKKREPACGPSNGAERLWPG